jgi:glycogen synthase
MRIVLISPEYPPAERMGGIGTNTETVAKELARCGHEVAVVVTDGGPATESANGVEVVRLRPRWVPNPQARLLLARRGVARTVRSLRPDVVQAPEWLALAWWVARFGPGPLVTRLATPTYLLEELNAGGPRSETSFLRRLERAQAGRSAAVLAPTRAIAERVGGDWELDPARIEVIPSPVDVEGVRRLGAGPLPDGIRAGGIVFVGRLERRKGIDVLGAALARVLAEHPDSHATLIGRDAGEDGGDVMTRFRREVGSVAERVHVLGELPRDEALAIVARADVVVLPSLWENLANACLEAMALGRAVVATRVGGFEELVTDGENGWLVAPGDADALAEALSRALADPDASRGVGEAAATRAQELDVPAIGERLVALYERVAQHGTGFDESIYRRGYRRYFHPEDERDPFRRAYEAKRVRVLARLERPHRLRILDVGGGYGRFAGPLSHRHDLTLLDVSPEMLDEARRSYPDLELVQGDARSLPFTDGSFDVVLAIDLLPHLQDLDGVQELARVTRSGGEVVFDTTNASPWWVLFYPRYVNWRPKRLVRTMLGGGVLPEWSKVVRHHRAVDVERALEGAGLTLEDRRGFGPPLVPKWHLWWTRKR